MQVPRRPIVLVLTIVLGATACSTTATSTDESATTDPATSSPTASAPATSTPATSTADGPAVTSAPAPLATVAPYTSAIYTDPAHWVCRPDADDACDGELATTDVAPDGSVTVQPYEVAVDPPIDCFYAYPTSSDDPTVSSDLVVGREAAVARVQVGAFNQVCDVYAPLYRSVTLAGLFGTGLGGTDLVTAWDAAYADVADAWRHYLANDNHGRPVVLIGHSQGTAHLIRLIREEIDPDPDRRAQLVSGILIGGAVAVPPGQTVGGAFQHLALCATADETGCIITYASYPETTPPGDDALFGRPNQLFAGPTDAVAGCTDPAELLGEPTLRARFPTASWAFTDGRDAASITTPFMSFPGLISARCVEQDGRGWLEVAVDTDPADPRADDLEGRLSPGWGWHAIDMELAQASLVEVVRRQVAAISSGS